jgi:hypothetical protein
LQDAAVHAYMTASIGLVNHHVLVTPFQHVGALVVDIVMRLRRLVSTIGPGCLADTRRPSSPRLLGRGWGRFLLGRIIAWWWVLVDDCTSVSTCLLLLLNAKLFHFLRDLGLCVACLVVEGVFLLAGGIPGEVVLSSHQRLVSKSCSSWP